MDIRLLGPFEVWQGSSPIALGAPQQQALFAQLALHVGEVVSSEALIDGLWPQRPPASATKSIQIYVSNLRRALPPGTIATQGAGYRLTAQPAAVDAVRFERLVGAARSDLAAGRPDAAAAALRDGLALWRGDALEPFRDEAFAITPVAALEELHWAAMELSFRTEVERGRGSDVLTELQDAVRRDPLREGLRALLMRALYQAGRQAEALATYHEARHLLADELGLDPSPELRRLERSILLQEDELLGSPRNRRLEARDAEQKLATILVAIPGASPTEDDERHIALLDDFGRAMLMEIERAGGTAERLADGGVRGTFGAPIAMEDHAIRAVEAASRARAHLAAGLDRDLRPQVGLETGRVMVQSSGASLLVVGPATRQAAALAELAQPGEILVAARTAVAARRFTYGVIREATLAGTRSRYAALLDAGPQPRSVGSHRRGFIGRTRELQLLRARRLAAFASRSPSAIVLIGEPGVGKTRLAQVAGERPPRNRGSAPDSARELWGRCIAYGEARTYHPIAEMLISHLRLPEAATAEEILRRLGERPILGLMLGLDVAGDAHPFTAQERLHRAWIDLVGQLVMERPLVLVFEDLHWAEQPLLDLIGRLVAEVSGPLLVVATARPEFIDRWNLWGASRSGFSALWLEPLPPEDAADLLAARSGGVVAADLQSVLLERAEGNPFFLEELVGSVIDAGRVASRAESERAPGERIPDSVQATIAARIDLLPAPLKTTLQVAAVIGREFSTAAVDSILASIGMPVARAEAFGILDARSFIQPVSGQESGDANAYAFRHALLRDVAFESLPTGRRAPLHAAFAAWLLRHGGGRDEDAPVLAYHLGAAATGFRANPGAGSERVTAEGARLRAEAVRWLTRAAELAVRRYELDAGDRLLRQAIELSPDDATMSQLWRALARIGYLRYDGEAFWSAMEHSLGLTTGAAEKAEMYGLLAETTAIRRGMWRRQPAQIRLNEWIERALRLAPAHSTARARALVARAWTAAPQASTRARDVSEAALLAAELGDVELRSHVLGEQAREEIVRNRYREARETIDRHLDLEARMDDPDEQALTLQQAVANLLSCGAIAEAAHAAKRLELRTERLSPHHRVHAIAAEASVRVLHGSPGDVLDLLPLVRERTIASADTPCIAATWSMLVCATAALRAGDDRLARELEDLADAQMMEGYDQELGAQRIVLAILRDDAAGLTELMTVPLIDRWNGWFLSSIVPPYLDALVALGDRDRIETEASPFAASDSVFEPYAGRAVAIARRDDGDLELAREKFLSLGLTTADGDTALLRRRFERAERGRAELGRGLRPSEAAH